jgi:hypothetical protein
MPRPTRLPALALAAATSLAMAGPATATISARWTQPQPQWQPILVPREDGGSQQDLLNMRFSSGAHPSYHFEWIRPEDGVVRASTAPTSPDDVPLFLGTLSLHSPPGLPDLFTWVPGSVSDQLLCYAAPGPGGPGPGFLGRPYTWRILVPTSGGGLPPLYFLNVEGGADLEVVIQAPRDVVSVYDQNGVLLQAINLPQAVGGDRFTDYQLSFADMEGDGRNEIIVTYPDNGPAGNVSVSVLGSSAPTNAPAGGIPVAPSLAPLTPNPALGRSLVTWTLPQASQASVRVYDAAGRQVRTLLDGASPAGTYSQVWDGRDDDGRRLPAGVYMVEVAAGGFRQSRKSVMLR